MSANPESIWSNAISIALIAIPTFCYAGVAINEYARGNRPMALTFAAYALANIGLGWGMWR